MDRPRSRSRSPSQESARQAAMSPFRERENAHPVFSDYCHMCGNIGSLSFAVGLRCADPEAVVSKIIPLTKVVSGQKKERAIRRVLEVEERTCTRPECVARVQKLAEIHQENEHLRVQLKTVEARCAAAKNKAALTETANAMVEEKNDELRSQIDEVQMAIQQAEAEALRGDSQNQVLRNQLTVLQKEIEKLRAQTEEKASVMQSLKEKAVQEVQFSRKHTSQTVEDGHRRDKLASEVAALCFDDIDSDDDGY